MTRNSLAVGLRVGARALKQAQTAALGKAKAGTAGTGRSAAKSRAHAGALTGPLAAGKPGRRGLVDCVPGIAFGAAGARRYYLYKPPDLALSERLPLLVMLHGCGQDADAFALSTRMNRVAARERFLVL